MRRQCGEVKFSVWLATFILITYIILSPCFFSIDVFGQEGISKDILTVHSSIQISSNIDFTPENGVSGGNGTISNPWIIEKLSITSKQYINNEGGVGQFCIFIYNTTDHFIIQNIYVSNVTATYGIYLYHVSNGVIRYNLIENNYNTGIIAFSSDNIQITNNTIRQHNNCGLCYLYSNNIHASNNTFSSNKVADIGDFYSNNSHIGQNSYEIGISIDGAEPYISDETPDDTTYIWILTILIAVISVSIILFKLRCKRKIA
ncbi:MAG: right-handed parallel beta-helix repeat-containing protein [Candidatus Thermoplasmatota archaeon]|nr:right-handed parallel beta-helix repeat-containing protein [Euryarchaeota archaeon]MBU4145236.1 right-handed parallel beta-helix repeat-containing protein [Candidatus Thermoplasmatota archaeon]MBU4592275.1 right-handed parallel beta-helix repeat-containing protein [Candidatus Thermoplasmatota archaeon]